MTEYSSPTGKHAAVGYDWDRKSCLQRGVLPMMWATAPKPPVDGDR
jgi:hypothetical protein